MMFAISKDRLALTIAGGVLATVAISAGFAADRELPAGARKTAWGDLREDDQGPNRLRLHVADRPRNGKLDLPNSLPSIAQAYFSDDRLRTPLALEFDPDTSGAVVRLPPDSAPGDPLDITLETIEKSQQLADGRILFSPLDAEIVGQGTRLEGAPGNDRIHFGSNPDDSVRWKYRATRPGTYRVELTYSLAGGDGTEFEITMAGKELTGRLGETRNPSTYSTTPLGSLAIARPGESIVTARFVPKSRSAAMNLKAITLRPISEGASIRQSADGSVTCHARDVIIHGIQVQYEPKPEKNTVGYWTVPTDQVSWEFELNMPGRFTVEVLQGCGKGQGGSDVALSIAGQTLRFTVEDTGHFQNFLAREIGTVSLKKVGTYTLKVAPQTKPGVAVMDLRQVRLIPVRAAN